MAKEELSPWEIRVAQVFDGERGPTGPATPIATNLVEALQELEANGVPVPYSSKAKALGLSEEELWSSVGTAKNPLFKKRIGVRSENRKRSRILDSLSLGNVASFGVVRDSRMEFSYTIYPPTGKAVENPFTFPVGFTLAPSGIAVSITYEYGRPDNVPKGSWDDSTTYRTNDDGRGNLGTGFPGILEARINYGPEPAASLSITFDDYVPKVDVTVVGFIY